jgi:branched-chain amino acid transport system substrate-binding protein
MKKNTLWILVICAVIVIFLFNTGGEKINKSIKIGVIAPLSGGAASYGEALKNGFELAIEDINSKGGIAGFPVEVVYEDSKCNGKDALTAVQKLISTDKIDYLFGGMCSSEVLAILPITEAKPMIFLGEGSSADITGKGKYFFRTWPSDALSSKALADYIVPKYKKIAIIGETSEYATALTKSYSTYVPTIGGEIVATETFTGDTKDFRSSLIKIKQANPEVLFINAQTGQAAAAIAKQARDLGITSQFILYFFTGDEYVKSGPAVNGSIILDTPSLDSSRPQAGVYTETYQKKFGNMSYPFVGAQMYDLAHLLKTAVEKNGNNPDKVKSYLHNMSAYNGVIGDFSFDQYGDVKNIGFSFKTIKDNMLVDLK